MRKQYENNETPRKPFDATAEQRLTHLSLIDDWGRIANPLLADPMFWIGYIEKVGTGTEDIVNLCKDKGLQSPEYHQEEDFRVVIWRKKTGNDPEVIQNDPEVIQTVHDLICANHSISRADLAKTLKTSERQVRKAIDALRDKKIRRKGGDAGEWEIIG